jgi:hypothetical protein
MKATSRDRRSSFATTTGHLAVFAAANAAAKLRSPIESVGALAGLDLGEFGKAGETLGVGEAGERRSLGFNTKTGSPLSFG